jgi:glycosyltransferase involved in cell wall biosynthesis
LEETTKIDGDQMKRILLRAPVLTQSGYGVHSRQIARWLLNTVGRDRLRVQALPWGMTPWVLNSQDDQIKDLYELLCQTPQKFDVSIQVQLPTEWDRSLSDVTVGVTAGVETDRVNQSWVAACNNMDKIIVPSIHTLNAFINSGADRSKFAVVPESFPAAFLNPVPQSAKINLNLSQDTFGILIVGQLTHDTIEGDRKNIFNAIKWTREALATHKNAAIVLKTNKGRNTSIDHMVISNLLARFVQETCPKGPPLHIIHGDLSDEEMLSIYTNPAIKCYVSLTRGEGFGLPTLEAAACGLPIIATDWSAHTEYLGQRWGRVVKKLVEIPKSRIDNSIFIAGAKWAEPDENNYKQKLLKLKDSYRMPSDWAAATKIRLHQTHSPTAIEQEWQKAIGQLL